MLVEQFSLITKQIRLVSIKLDSIRFIGRKFALFTWRSRYTLNHPLLTNSRNKISIESIHLLLSRHMFFCFWYFTTHDFCMHWYFALVKYQIYAIFLLAVVTKLLIVNVQMLYVGFIHSQIVIKLDVSWENPNRSGGETLWMQMEIHCLLKSYACHLFRNVF